MDAAEGTPSMTINLSSGMQETKNEYQISNCTDYALKKHLRAHNNVVNHEMECEIYEYKSKECHEGQHKLKSTQKTYECIMCDYKTLQVGHYNRHIKTHMGQNRYKCDICSYEAAEAGTLKRHKRTHSGEKPYQCDYCNRKFTQRAHLHYHIRTHIELKNCSDQIQNYDIYDIKSTPLAKRHSMKIHTGKKRFVCETCEYSSVRHNDLKEHERIHTKERPYECTICEYKTVKSSHLKRHFRIHTGEKPYKCTLCNYKANIKSSLKTHIKKCTGKNLCKMCNFESNTSKGLQNHLRKHGIVAA